MLELKYPLFDGEKFWKSASVTVENGVITDVRECEPSECGEGVLMPGLIDGHIHIDTTAPIERMLQSGITTACDVCAPKSLVENSNKLEIISSLGMAMGVVMNPKSYVERAVENGARYVKVLLFNALSIGKPALCGIVKNAHKANLKVAVHATETATVKQAVDAEADILLHVPMKEEFPRELAEAIARKGIAVAPTLVMMEAFAHSGRKYTVEDYENAKNAVKMLRECGVTILAATDANSGSFAPAVEYGKTLHYEMKLLSEAGLTPLEALKSATSENADAFGLNTGRIKVGMPATMALAQMTLEKDNFNVKNIEKVWVKGERI